MPFNRKTYVVHSKLAIDEIPLQAPRSLGHGTQVMSFEQLAVRLAGGFTRAVVGDRLRAAIQEVLPTMSETDRLLARPAEFAQLPQARSASTCWTRLPRRVSIVVKMSVLLGIALLALSMFSPLRAASFDCTKAQSSTERMICGDPQLSKMDEDLGALYVRAKALAPDPVAFKKQTNLEWRYREKNCTDQQCLIDWYQRRTAQLAAVISASQANSTQTPAAAGRNQVDTSRFAPVSKSSDDSDSSSIAVWVVLGVVFLLWMGRRGAKKPRTLAKGAGPFVKAETQERPATSSARTRPGKSLPTVWIPPGESTTVAGLSLPLGMIYVGSTLTGTDGTPEPAQIDPLLEIDPRPVDPAERLFGYWPGYSHIPATARRAYLTWLAGARCDPNADIGYVFLFYYGLERRVLVDAVKDSHAAAEIPQILSEIARLQSIYNNNSFQRYSGDLVNYLASKDASARLYLREPPPASASGGLSLSLRVGLGQTAIDNQPVPATWALAWARSDPNIRLPTAAKRCPSQFDTQFTLLYRKQDDEGMRLSVNRTKLKVSYRPASGALAARTFSASLGDLPDVTAVITPSKKLQALVDECAASLDAYSRFVGRHTGSEQSLEATLLLPPALWSEPIKNAVQRLDERVGTGMLLVGVGEVISIFGGSAGVTRERLKGLFQSLQARGVGVEPDVLTGAKMPKLEDSVVLFRLEPEKDNQGTKATSEYEAAAVIVDLAMTLAHADGRISGREVQFLNRQIDTWTHVGAGEQKRLRARLRLKIAHPPTLASLKSRIEPLPAAARSALAKVLSALALADGKLSADAVKHLEKIYRLLGIDTTALYNELHGVSAALDRGPSVPALSAPSPSPPSKPDSPDATPSTGGIKLDRARIAALQVETERVTEMLSKVFAEQETAERAILASAEEPQSLDAAEPTPTLLGMDAEHSAFLRLLLTRPSWSRAELEDMSADMELMLDGALERINEASLDAYERAVVEGEDPMEIAQDLLQDVPA